MPPGIEPRVALPYSFAIIWIISHSEIQNAIDHLKKISQEQDETIQEQSITLAHKIANCIPAIYTTPLSNGLAIRLHQRLNENSKMLCRHHIILEMNHNELLGRESGNKHVQTIFITNPDETLSNQKRIKLTQQVLQQRQVPYHSISHHEQHSFKKCSLAYIKSTDSPIIHDSKESRPQPNAAHPRVEVLPSHWE